MGNKKQNAIHRTTGTVTDHPIAQPNKQSICVEIEGTSSLIQNNFSQKAVEQMLRKHMGITVQKETKRPREVLEAATIRNLDKRIEPLGRVCVPPVAFKKAMLSAAGNVKLAQKPWQLKSMLFVRGQSVPITYEKMEPRMDMVRTSGAARVPDVRFRPEFFMWRARLIVEHSDLVTSATVLDLVNRAGDVGVGEWRPEKSGTFGCFKVSRPINDAEEYAEVREQCSYPLVALRIPEWALDANIDPELLKEIVGANIGESPAEAAE